MPLANVMSLRRRVGPGFDLVHTTPSLEALQKFTAGKVELSQGHFLTAVPLFERATVLSHFAFPSPIQ